MPAIIGAVGASVASSTSALSPSGTALSTSSSSRQSLAALMGGVIAGAPSWATTNSDGSLGLSGMPALASKSPGGSQGNLALVPVGSFLGYRSVINAMWASTPPPFSATDWSMTFQPDTNFDKTIASFLPGNDPVGVSPTGQFVDLTTGQPVQQIIWFTVTYPGLQLLQVSISYNMADNKALWIAATTASSVTSTLAGVMAS
jgi:hypothetical protein